MNYAAGAQLQANNYRTNRKLTRTDGVFPTDTMRLHHRIIDWHRKRRIPVKVADAKEGNNLSAYLIDPQYLDEGKGKDSKVIPVTYIPSNLPIYQYSKITRDNRYKIQPTTGPLAVATGQLLHGIKLGFNSFASDLIARYRSLRIQNTSTHYKIGSGVTPWWKQRIRFFATAFITGGLLIAAVAFTPDNPSNPTPVSAHPNPGVIDKTELGNTSKSSLISSPTTGQKSTATNPVGLAPQPSISTPTQSKLSAQQLAAGPTNSAPITSTSPPTTPIPMSTTPLPTVTTIVDPVVTPITDTVKSVLSTQITVSNP